MDGILQCYLSRLPSHIWSRWLPPAASWSLPEKGKKYISHSPPWGWGVLTLIWALSCSWWPLHSAIASRLWLFIPHHLPGHVGPVLTTNLQPNPPPQPHIFQLRQKPCPELQTCLAGILTLCFPIPAHSSKGLGPLPVPHPGPSNPAAEFVLPASVLLDHSFLLLPDRPVWLGSHHASHFNPPKFRHHQTSSGARSLICNMKGLC